MQVAYKLLFFSSIFLIGFSKANSQTNNYSFIGLGYSVGKTSTANVNFPSLDPQQGVLLSIGSTHKKDELEWAYRLNYPTTGITISYVDLGNSEQLGNTVSVVPFIDFNILKKWTNKLNFKIGLGASYFNKIYDEVENPNNKAISTHFTWAFRSNLYYSLLEKENFNLKLGVGYFHNSNGHTRLPNNGLNTFLVSAYSQFNFNKKVNTPKSNEPNLESHFRTTQKFYSLRFGIGQKVLSKYSTDTKEVYAFEASSGKIINKTFKIGYGFYYRFYQDYYDYIKDDEKLVRELYPEFKDNPTLYASNVGLFVNGELLLSHFGVEYQLGFNLYKPAYKIDWQINEEKYVDGVYQLGELDWYYNIKKTISSRLGAKLYALNTNKSPQHNVFLGAYINSNFGQADFTELTLGYLYCLPSKERKK